jgi:UDP-glucose 4-epimerase
MGIDPGASRYLITGGAGFIGSHLADRLARGDEVVALDDCRRPGEQHRAPADEPRSSCGGHDPTRP